MNELEIIHTQCPYCGEPIELVIDCSLETQCYIEDCQVCCRPINVAVEVDAKSGASVQVSQENDV